MNYEPVIGLEVHVQLKTQSKMFCRSSNSEAAEPNLHICEVCTGQPGTLPVINREAVRKAVMVGMALNCQIAEYSKFDRKNYFYPDLPKGYQISQFDMPINGKGHLDVLVNGETRRVGITRAHLEEDAGKLMHPAGASFSLVDYNRAGTPLLEIVSDPDIKGSEDAKAYLQEIQNIVRYLGVSDADMEKGHLRCDANVSLRVKGETGLPNYKVEIKNMNSFKAVAAAIEHEIVRQAGMLEEGNRPVSETRGWLDDKMITVSQRLKEESQDYRYFPEPDLPVLHFSKEWLEDVKRSLPELPAQRKARLVEQLGMAPKDAATLVENKQLSDYLEDVMSELDAWMIAEKIQEDAATKAKYLKLAVTWALGQFSALLNEHKLGALGTKITPENFSELLKLIGMNKVSQLSAKDVFAKMFETGEDPSDLLESMGLAQVSDEGLILDVVRKIIAANPKGVEDVKTKGERAFGFLVGQAMKELKGKGNPQMINEMLKKELGA